MVSGPRTMHHHLPNSGPNPNPKPNPKPNPTPEPEPEPDQVRALAREKRIELPHVLKQMDASPGALRALRRMVRGYRRSVPRYPCRPVRR